MEVENIHFPFSKTLFSSSITLKFASLEIMKVWPLFSHSISSIGEFNMLQGITSQPGSLQSTAKEQTEYQLFLRGN